MFEDGTVSDFEDMVQIRLVTTGAWASVRKITETSGAFRQIFPCHLCIRLPADAVIGEKAIHYDAIDGLTADQIDGRFVKDADVPTRIEAGHRGLS
jgi:hypothetical protein